MGEISKEGEKAGEKEPKPIARPKDGMLTEAQYKDRMRRRLFRTLDYASIAFSMLIIYASIMIADYLFIKLIDTLFHEEIADSRTLATVFNGIKKGLAILAFALATIHGIKSAVEQYKLDEKLTKEDEKPHV